MTKTEKNKQLKQELEQRGAESARKEAVAIDENVCSHQPFFLVRATRNSCG